MKKTVSMLLAVLMAAIAVCTFGVSAFADETTVAANDDPVDNFVTEAPTTAAPTTAAPTAAPTTAAPTTAAPSTAAPTTAAPTTAAPSTTKSIAEKQSELDAEEVVTRDPSAPAPIIDETTNAAPATTKKPAKVESNIPSTGSTVVPVIALLALAAGTVAVVKTKKED